MNEQERDNLYYSTDFAKQLAEIRKNPEILDTKEKLVDFWRLALRDRNNNKSIQERIAMDAARTVGTLEYGFEYGRPEDNPYQAVIMQFAWMDHMDRWRMDEAEIEWAKLADMLSKFKTE